MSDLRVFVDVTNALGRLVTKHDAQKVLAVVEDWVAYMHKVEETIRRYQAPDTPEELTQTEEGPCPS